MEMQPSGHSSVPGLAPPLAASPPSGDSFGVLAGAIGPRIRFERAAVLLVALVAADVVWMLVDYVRQSGGANNDFVLYFRVRAVVVDLVQVGMILVFFRMIRNALAAAAAMAAAYTVLMAPLTLVLQTALLEGAKFSFQFHPVPLFRSWIGTFLFFGVMAVLVPRIRPLWLGLMAGAGAGLVAANVFQMLVTVIAYRESFSTSFEGLLTTIASSLGGAVVFGSVFWGGLKAVGYTPGESLAFQPAAGAGLSGRAAELQQAANFRTVRRLLRPAGIGSIVFGVIAVGLGAASMEENPVNAVLLFLGVFLFVEGIWLVVSPSPAGMLVDGFALGALGLWNIFITLANVSSGARGPGGFAVLGVFQIILAFQSFNRYRRFAGWPMQKPSEADLQFLDRALQPGPHLIQFRLGQGRAVRNWKAGLLDDFGVFHEEKEERIVIAPRDGVSFTSLSTGTPGKDISVRVSLPGIESEGAISAEAMDRIQRWKNEKS